MFHNKMAFANPYQCAEKTVCESQTEEASGKHGNGSDRESTSSPCRNSDCSDDLEPEWLDDIQKNGELFYLELSEGEDEAALAQAKAIQCVSTNHVRFSENEAEVITEQNKKQRCGSRTKGEPALKILRRKRRPSQRRGGGKDGGKYSSTLSPPASILKNQPGQRQGVMVQQQQLKEVCIYLNPKRLVGSSTPVSDSGGLLEALLGVMHRPSWSRRQRDPGFVKK